MPKPPVPAPPSIPLLPALPALCLLLLPLLLLGSAVRAQEDCHVRCWLAAATIALSDIEQTATVLGQSVDLKITGAAITGSSVAAIASSNPTPTALALAASGINATIAANVQFTLAGVTMDADVSARVHDTSVAITSEFVQNSDDELPDNLTMVACDSTVALSDLSISGSLADGIANQLAPQLASMLQAMVQSQLCSVLRSANDDQISSVVAELTATLRPYLSAYNPPDDANLVDLPAGLRAMTRNAVVDALATTANELVGPHGVNWVATRLARGRDSIRMANINDIVSVAQGKKVRLSDALWFNIPVSVLGSGVKFGISDFHIWGANTFNTVDLFDTNTSSIDVDHTLKFRAAVDSVAVDVSFWLNVSAWRKGPVTVPTGTWMNLPGDFQVNVSGLSLDVMQHVYLKQAWARRINHNQLTDGPCVLSLFERMPLPRIRLGMQINAVTLTPDSSADSDADVYALVARLASAMAQAYSAAIPAVINGAIISGIAGPVESVNGSVCGEDDEGRPVGFEVGPSVSGFAWAACCTGLFVGLSLAFERRGKEAEIDWAVNVKKEDKGRRGRGLLNRVLGWWRASEDDPARRPCLMVDARIPKAARLLVPIVLFVDGALYFSSNTGTGYLAFVQLFWRSRGAEGHVVETEPLLEIKILDIIKNFWDTRAYPVSFFIAFVSGGWPYLKLVITLACWSLPLVSPRWRGRLLTTLHIAGKWSMLEPFFMTIVIVAMSTIVIPMPAADPADTERPFKVAFKMLPAYGLATYLWASMVQLVLIHVVLYYHTRLRKLDNPADDPFETFPVIRDWLGGISPWAAWPVRGVLFVLSVVTVVLLVAGTATDGVSFHVKGAAGKLMDNVFNASTTSGYSQFGFAMAIPGATPSPNAFAVRLLAVLFVCMALLVPCVYMVAVVVVLCVPLRTRAHWWVMAAGDVLYAWSCVDVYSICVIGAALMLPQIVSSMVAWHCRHIDLLLGRFFDGDLDGQNTCLAIETQLRFGLAEPEVDTIPTVERHQSDLPFSQRNALSMIKSDPNAVTVSSWSNRGAPIYGDYMNIKKHVRGLQEYFDPQFDDDVVKTVFFKNGFMQLFHLTLFDTMTFCSRKIPSTQCTRVTLSPKVFTMRLLVVLFMCMVLLVPCIFMFTVVIVLCVPLRTWVHWWVMVSSMVTWHCRRINLLSHFFDGDLDGQNTCLAIETQLRSGSWILLIGSLLHFIVSISFIIIYRRAIARRVSKAKPEVRRRRLAVAAACACAFLVALQLLAGPSDTSAATTTTTSEGWHAEPAPGTPQAVWAADGGALKDWGGRHYWVLAYMRRHGARAGQRVLDVGCGLMLIERELPAGMVYVPSDVVARDNRTLVADYLTQGLPPPRALPGGPVDWVLVLGVLEYMPDYARFARELRAYNASVVMTYAGVPDGVTRARGPGTHRGRLPYLWLNSLHVAEVWQLMRDAGFAIVEKRARTTSSKFVNSTTFLAVPI
eukprot:m51a1_g11400 hypothetical protein (1465) ;mRNA; r:20353-28244